MVKGFCTQKAMASSVPEAKSCRVASSGYIWNESKHGAGRCVKATETSQHQHRSRSGQDGGR